MSSWTVNNEGAFTRPLGDSEIPLYPASKTGLGDMFLHLGFIADAPLFDRSRVAIAWATLRVRHPVLAARVQPSDHNASFVYTHPADAKAAIASAEAALTFTHTPKDDLIATYMDGARTISDESLSHLTISRSLAAVQKHGKRVQFDILMAAPHFAGDGNTLHQTTHELLALVASPKTDQELETDLEKAIRVDAHERLADSAEDRLPSGPTNAWFRAAAKLSYLQVQQAEIGGHTLPREQRGSRVTMLLERSLEKDETTKALARCKKRGVSVNHALFALANLAWARLMPSDADRTLPIMMYTAMSLRPYLTPSSGGDLASYWFLALGYFNLVLPAFPPASRDVLWLRAKSVGKQTQTVLRSPFVVPRVKIAAAQRGARARGVDAASVGVPPSDALAALSPRPAAPSAALMGVSLVGNLDKVYDPVAGGYEDAIELQTVTTASRVKAGGLLLLAHSFGGKFWVHLCYDSNGFAEGKMEAFWEELGKVMREYLVEGDD